MEKIDLKDRKILYQFDLDSRQSLTQIGKKVGLPKDVVSYRLKKLIDKGIIKQFYTVIDSSKLGYASYRFYIVFQRTTPQIEQEIIEYFIKDRNVWWVCKVKGQFDLAVATWVKNIIEFDIFWEKTLQKYRYYFQNQIFSVYLQIITYKHSYILIDEYNLDDRKKYDVAGLGKKVDIDTLDFQILNLLAKNSRIPTLEIAQKLNSNTKTIKKRIQKMQKNRVITGFRISIDFTKLGYELYKVDVRLMDYKKRKSIIKYISSNPHLFAQTKTAGYTDLELDFIVEDVNQLLHIMNELSLKFPNSIKNYTYFYESEIRKIMYVPEIHM